MGKWIAAIIALVIVAAVVWYFFFRMTKDKAVKILKDGGFTSDPSSFDEAFIIAWSKAANKGNETFKYNGKEYMTMGGKAKV